MTSGGPSGSADYGCAAGHRHRTLLGASVCDEEGGNIAPPPTQDADTVLGAPSADDWAQAVAEVFGWYPYDVFPEASKSVDAVSARMARRTCIAICQQAQTNRAARCG